MVTLNQKNNEVLQELRYAYDSSGNITKIEDKVKDSLENFQYDDLNRLIKAAGEYGTLNYKYDSIGNLLEKEGTSYQYGARPHAATQFGNTTLTYDANGNMISKGLSPLAPPAAGRRGLSLAYDVENRLTEVKEGATITSFTYDGDGGRVRKGLSPQGTVPEQWTTYIGSLFEKDSDGTTRKHLFAGSQRIATKGLSPSELSGSSTKGTVPKISYYHSDHLGSSSVISDSGGKPLQRLSYLPYGKVDKQEGIKTTQPKFTGKELDSTGLYFYGARYYDPEVGRFISADTIVSQPYNPQDLNRYSYVNNNPINYIDPTGHWSWKKFRNSFIGALVGAIITVVTAGAGAPLWIAGMAGGFFGGGITGGLEGGWKGALIGAGMGAVLGGIGGWGVSHFGGKFAVGMLVVGAGVAGATDSWDSFAGGLTGGIVGAAVGGGIVNSEQFQNWKAGDGFRSDRAIRAAEYRKALDALNVNESDKVKVTVGSRPLAKDAAGNPGSPTGPRHRYLRWTENGQQRTWEMGPDANNLITARNSITDANWPTATTTDLSIGTPLARETTVNMSLSGLKNAISTYESFWVGQPYDRFSYNSNYAVNSIIYGDGANVPTGLGFAPGWPALL